MYEFTEEQRMLVDMVKKVAEKEIKPLVREVDNGKIPDSVWDLFVQQGFIGMFYPEEYGGYGASFFETSIMTEELAKADASCASLCAAPALSAPLVMFGTHEQKQKYLTRLASGEWRCCFALTEADAGSDAGSIKTRAEDMGDHYLVNGSKRFITHADTANLMQLFCKTDPTQRTRGISCLLVEMDTPGITVAKPEDKCGMNGFNSCEVFFDNVKVPKENLLGEENKGFGIAMQALNKNRIGTAFLAIGLAQGALDFAVQYAKERIQFGQPIGMNQGLQWMLADMAMQLEAARQLAYKSARLVDEEDDRLDLYGAMAKCYSTDVCMKVCTDAMQICGGNGYMKEYPQEKRFRDAKLLQVIEGSNQIQRIIIGRALTRD